MMASIEQVSMSQKTTGIQLFSLCFHLCIYIYISYTNEYIYIYMRMYKMLADCHLNTRVQPSCLGPWYLGFLLALVGNISTRVHPHVWGHDLWSQSVCLSRHHRGSKKIRSTDKTKTVFHISLSRFFHYVTCALHECSHRRGTSSTTSHLYIHSRQKGSDRRLQGFYHLISLPGSVGMVFESHCTPPQASRVSY